jgi:hypothetical protein
VRKHEKENEMKKIWMMVCILGIVGNVTSGQQGQKVPQTSQGPQMVQLSPSGKLAFRTVQQELAQLQADINELVSAEVKAQSLSGEGWQLNFQTGMLVRIAPALPSPAPPPTVVPTPDKGGKKAQERDNKK